MSSINFSGINNNQNPQYQNKVINNNFDIEDVSILYTTEKDEHERSTFEETFNETSVSSDKDGEEFLKGLSENKESLSKDLGLSDDEYDAFSFISLALASQETGMGNENGYEEENRGLGKLARDFGKFIDVLTGGKSASSGLTQMKIYDFLKGNQISDEKKALLEKYGIKANSIVSDNLFDNPDKAAVATMVVLTSLAENYGNYKNTLDSNNKEIFQKYSSVFSENELFEKGQNVINDISEAYKKAPDEEKVKIRETLKQVMLSQNGSTIGQKGVENDFNEELQIQELNKLLAQYNVEFPAQNLDYIRFYLSSEGNEMNITEYCAYAWNKGTGETGMQFDRMLTDKIGTILSNPEDFDYDQFTVNVATLADKYAQQSTNENGIDKINSALERFK